MTLQNEAEQLARAWIDGWNAGKPDDIPLAPDFTHSSPFGVVTGRETYLEWVKPLAAANVTSLEIVKVMGRDGDAVIWYKMTTSGRVLACCDWVQSAKGLILAVTSFYDATDLR